MRAALKAIATTSTANSEQPVWLTAANAASSDPEFTTSDTLFWEQPDDSGVRVGAIARAYAQRGACCGIDTALSIAASFAIPLDPDATLVSLEAKGIVWQDDGPGGEWASTQAATVETLQQASLATEQRGLDDYSAESPASALLAEAVQLAQSGHGVALHRLDAGLLHDEPNDAGIPHTVHVIGGSIEHGVVLLNDCADPTEQRGGAVHSFDAMEHVISASFQGQGARPSITYTLDQRSSYFAHNEAAILDVLHPTDA